MLPLNFSASALETAKAPSGVGPELTEAQQKLVDEDPTQTLDQQENMKISGTNARHMVMQKLMRKSEVSQYDLFH